MAVSLRGSGPSRAPTGHRRQATMRPVVAPPQTGDEWLSLTGGELPVDAVYVWAVRPEVAQSCCSAGPSAITPTVRGCRPSDLRGVRGSRRRPPRRYRERRRASAGRPSAGSPFAPDRPGRRRRVVGARRRVRSAPRRGVRGCALRHRRPEGIGPDLEARDLARRQRRARGPRRSAVPGPSCDRGHRRHRRGRRRGDHRRARLRPAGPTPWRSSSGRSMHCRRRPASPSSSSCSNSTNATTKRPRTTTVNLPRPRPAT